MQSAGDEEKRSESESIEESKVTGLREHIGAVVDGRLYAVSQRLSFPSISISEHSLQSSGCEDDTRSDQQSPRARHIYQKK